MTRETLRLVNWYNCVAAMQRREVDCQLNNGTEVEAGQCSEGEKPPQRQECYNDKCKGTWKVGEWSEVLHSYCCYGYYFCNIVSLEYVHLLGYFLFYFSTGLTVYNLFCLYFLCIHRYPHPKHTVHFSIIHGPSNLCLSCPFSSS